MRFLALVIVSAALTACSGTGVQYDQQVEKSVTTPDGTIFVAREGQWLGGGVLLKVVLNGTQLGELETKVLSGKLKEGQNTLTVKPQGMGKLSYSDESFNFQGALDKNSYFMIDLNNTLLGFGSSIVNYWNNRI